MDRMFTESQLQHTLAPFLRHDGGILPDLPDGVLAIIAGGLLQQGYDVWVLHEDRMRLRTFYEVTTQWVAQGRIHWFYPHNIPSAWDDAKEKEWPSPLWLVEHFQQKPRPSMIVFSHPVLAQLRFPSANQLQVDGIRIVRGESLDPESLADFLLEEGYEVMEFADRPGTYAWRGMIFDVFPFHAQRPVRIEFDDDRVAALRFYHPETQLSEGNTHEFLITGKEIIIQSANTPFAAFLKPNRRIFLVEPDYWSELSLLGQWPISLPSYVVGSPSHHSPTLTVKFETLPPLNRSIDHLIRILHTLHFEGYRTWIASPQKEDYHRLCEILELRGTETELSFFPCAMPNAFKLPADRIAIVPYQMILPAKSASRKRTSPPLATPHQLTPGDYVVHIDHGIGVFEGMGKMKFKGKEKEVLRIRYAGGDLLFVGIESMHKLSPYTPPGDKEVRLYKLGSGRWKRVRERAKEKIKSLTIDLIRLYSLRKSQKGYAFASDDQLMMEIELSFPHTLTTDQAEAWQAIQQDMESERPMDRLVCGDVGFGKTELAIRAAAKAAANDKQTAILVPTTVLALQHYQVFKERLAPLGITVDYVSRFRTPAENRRILQAVAAGKVDVLIGTHRLLSNDVSFLDLGLLIIDEEQKFGVEAKEKLRSLKTNVDTLALTATPIPRTLQFSLLGIRDISLLTTPPEGRKPVETVIGNFHLPALERAIRRELDRGGQVFFIHNRIKDLSHYAEIIQQMLPKASVTIAHGQMESDRLEEIMYFFVRGRYDILVTTSLVESGLHIPSVNTIIINNAHHFGLSDLYQLRGRVGRSYLQGYCYLLVPSLRTLPTNSRRRLHSLRLHQDLGSGFKIAMHDLAIRGAGNLFGAEQSGFVAEMGYETYEKVLLEALYEMQQEGMLPSQAEPTLRLLHRKVQKITVETDLPTYLPDAYVPSAAHRMAFYQRLNEATSEAELTRWIETLRDQYGPLPTPARHLISVVRLRWMLQGLPVEKVTHQSGKVTLYLTGQDPSFYQSAQFDALLELLQKYPDRCGLLQRDRHVMIKFDRFPTLEAFCKWFDTHRETVTIQ